VRVPDRHPVVHARLTGSLMRAAHLLARLDVARRPADVEAAVAGLRHELRTALRAVGLDPEQVLAEADAALVDHPAPPAEVDTPPELPFVRPD
jgi:hypothetical protein